MNSNRQAKETEVNYSGAILLGYFSKLGDFDSERIV